MRESNNLGDVFHAHTDAEFKARDMETTMATMGAAPRHLVLTMPGGHAATRCGVFTRLGSSAIGRRTPWSRRSRAPRWTR